MGRKVTAAIAVIEDGNATYAVGDLTQPEFREHFSKVDMLIGVHLRENEMVRTENLLELAELSGIEILKSGKDYSTRYYQRELTLKVPTKEESVVETLRAYLQSQGFSVARSPMPLHVKHLERMRHRTGYIIPRGDS